MKRMVPDKEELKKAKEKSEKLKDMV